MIWPWIITSDLEKQWTSSSHPDEQVNEVVWSSSLRFGLYHAYKVSMLSDAKTLTFDLDKQQVGFYNHGK
jgi:hypothetical protein